MKNSLNSSAQQPMIVKYVEALHNGIQSQALSRYAIGYILRGTKYIYEGDKRQTLTRGDVFYLGIGHHYIENFPENGQPFEQVLFYYTPADLQRILMHLNITYGLNISNEHSCENCRNRTHVAMPAWNSIRNFFVNTNNYLRDEDFHRDETAENIKMTELIYLIASHEDCCIKSKLLSNVDAAKENFEQIPDELYRAAKVDGTSDLKYLCKVMIPICKPTMVTIAILKVIECWNSYIWPRLITDDQNYYLVSNGIQEIRENGFGRENVPAMMAAVVVISLPLIILFLLFRNKIMSGVSRGGTKG